MPLTDQQLRQELIGFGESVPPITQRNREQLQARLEVLRAQPRSRATTSAVSSTSRLSTRSRPVPGLIELSDSETETPPNASSTSTASHTQTRSIAVQRRTEPTSTGNMTVDVEQSIARHRREIQQLIDSARERTLAMNTSIAAGQKPVTTPFRSSSSANYSRSKSKVDIEKVKQPSWFHRSRTTMQTFWKQHRNPILETLKALLIGGIIGAGLIFLKTKGPDLIPHRKGITCTVQNATDCDEMNPVIDAIRKQLQIRAGEVDCGFRPKSDMYVSKADVNKYLDQKGFKFESGPEERWQSLIIHILRKPIDDVLVFNNKNELEQDAQNVVKLSTNEAIRSLSCRVRKGVNSVMHHLAWLFLGTSSFLLFAWFIKRRSKQYEENENTYKDLVQKITDLLENQYEEHLRDSETHPWLAISHVRDMLVPVADRKRLKLLWERAKKQISESESRVRAESQVIHGEEFDVWKWIQPRSPSSPSSPRKKRAESPKSPNEESYVYMPADVGLTECLKLRNFFDPDNVADDDEIDLVVDSIQNRCATVRRIEHIGIHSIFVYLKFSSKEGAAQGFHLLNNWRYHGRDIIAKYLRLERYHDHFPEARDSGSSNN